MSIGLLQPSIALSPWVRKFFQQQIESGSYNNVSEVIRAGLLALRTHTAVEKRCFQPGDRRRD
ncbi:type II toxin-antitoxin system ParD family antitoxin [Erwinia aphidicola]